jgi:peroxiredoxin Q/BCP
LARLRDGYQEFVAQGAEILAIGPDKPKIFASYWHDRQLPFIGLPDEKRIVSKLYKQEVNLFKLGRMPLNTIVDRKGIIRYIHYGKSMADIPDNDTLLEVIDQISEPSE